MAFSPNNRRVLFCRANDDFSSYDVYETEQENGSWRAPVKPSFAASWSNADPHFSPDGRTVFFISNRPEQGESGASEHYDIWSVSVESGHWGEPHRLPAPIATVGADEWSPSVAANGDLYFGSDRPGGRGGLDLYVARWVRGAYQKPENLGAMINTAANEVEPWVAPDGSYLIFSATERPDNAGAYDLYLSRRLGNTWRDPEPIASVNTRAAEFNQSISPDGRWLYFSSTRRRTGPLGERFDTPRTDASIAGIGNGKGDIYRIQMSELGLDTR